MDRRSWKSVILTKVTRDSRLVTANKFEPTQLADALTSYVKQAGLTKRVQQAGLIE